MKIRRGQSARALSVKDYFDKRLAREKALEGEGLRGLCGMSEATAVAVLKRNKIPYNIASRDMVPLLDGSKVQDEGRVNLEIEDGKVYYYYVTAITRRRKRTR